MPNNNLEEITRSQSDQRRIDWPATIAYLPALGAYTYFGMNWIEEHIETSKIVSVLLPPVLFTWAAGAFVLRKSFEKSAKLIRRYTNRT